MNGAPSDALVFFGATGDLAFKKIFPALQRMVQHGRLAVPVIGVAKAGWGLARFQERARESLAAHGGVDPGAFAKLCAGLRYVDGDYGDPATFQAVRRELGAARHPTHYLAIPPALFPEVVQQLERSGCAAGARVVVEERLEGPEASCICFTDGERVRLLAAIPVPGVNAAVLQNFLSNNQRSETVRCAEINSESFTSHSSAPPLG